MKKIIIAAASFFALLGILTAGLSLAMPLENNYPVIGNNSAPTSTRSDFTSFIKYGFNIAIIASALIAFCMMVYGGFQYLSSAGNTSRTKIALDTIYSAFLGLAVILCSWIFLSTINPRLVTVEMPTITPIGDGVKVTLKDGAIYTYTSSVPSFDGTVVSVEFSPASYDVYSYSEPEWKGTKSQLDGSTSIAAKSLQITGKIPGVYLCYFEIPDDKDSNEICQPFQGDTPYFGSLKGKFTKIKIIDKFNDSGKAIKKYIAIVFKNENYAFGGLKVFEAPTASQSGSPFIVPGDTPFTLPDSQKKQTLDEEITAGWASSIRVFSYNPEKDHPGNVKVCSEEESKGHCQNIGEEESTNNLEAGVNDEARSIDIQGERIAILCDKDDACTRSGQVFDCGENKCQVFTSPNPYLESESIGKCRSETFAGVSIPWVKNLPCASYFIIKTFEKE